MPEEKYGGSKETVGCGIQAYKWSRYLGERMSDESFEVLEIVTSFRKERTASQPVFSPLVKVHFPSRKARFPKFSEQAT